MRMEYQKPYLAVESFQLNAAIAGACSAPGMMALGHSPNTCTLQDEKGDKYGTLTFFGAACDTAGGIDIVNNDTPDKDYCYQALNGVFQNS